MPVYTLTCNGRDYPIEFPHNAYDCQRVYMEHVISALAEGQNALLESPTGTGKTLCLLCSTLAWRESLPIGERPQIIYSSRTHSQLSQVIKELKTTRYRPRMTLLAARAHMCVNDKAKALGAAETDNKCRQLVANKGCPHHNAYMQVMKNSKESNGCNDGMEPLDLEDLNRLSIGSRMDAPTDGASGAAGGAGQWDSEDRADLPQVESRKQQLGGAGGPRSQFGKAKYMAGPCSYYMTRQWAQQADIIFVPYNYILDDTVRATLTGVTWKDSIVIFDEAHNLESVCNDSASFDISALFLATCIQEAASAWEAAAALLDAGEEMPQMPGSGPGGDGGEGLTAAQAVQDFMALKNLLVMFEQKITEATPQGPNGVTYPADWFFSLLHGINITLGTIEEILVALEVATNILSIDATTAPGQKSSRKRGATNLETLGKNLKAAFKAFEQGDLHAYRVHLRLDEPRTFSRAPAASKGGAAGVGGAGGGAGSKAKVPLLGFWCFRPGICMQKLVNMGVRSLVITSGTLSPMDSFAFELGLPFPVRLENTHVIDQSQLWAGCLQKGPAGNRLNSSHGARDTDQYKEELGNCVVNFARVIPDGVLVIFPSYHVMNICIERWQASGNPSIWERLLRLKHVVVEPRDSASFPAAKEDYTQKLEDPNKTGAVFFGVCRGKVSEGIDFSDKAGRAVILTGIPYAVKTDPKVIIKRQVLDEDRAKVGNNGRAISGNAWYQQSAVRAVNQALGRVIRHRHDFGAVILLDERFHDRSLQNELSKWLRPSVHNYDAFGKVTHSLGQFFKTRAAVSAALPPRETDKSVRPGMQGSSGAAGPSFSASAGQQQQGFPQPGRGAGLGALLAAHGFSGGAAARGLDVPQANPPGAGNGGRLLAVLGRGQGGFAEPSRSGAAAGAAGPSGVDWDQGGNSRGGGGGFLQHLNRFQPGPPASLAAAGAGARGGAGEGSGSGSRGVWGSGGGSGGGGAGGAGGAGALQRESQLGAAAGGAPRKEAEFGRSGQYPQQSAPSAYPPLKGAAIGGGGGGVGNSFARSSASAAPAGPSVPSGQQNFTGPAGQGATAAAAAAAPAASAAAIGPSHDAPRASVTSKEYLNAAKIYLSEEEYQQFRAILATHKEKKDIGWLISRMEALIDPRERPNLFCNFQCCLPPEGRPVFVSRMAELEAQGILEAPPPSVDLPQKRPGEATGAGGGGGPFKRQETGGGVTAAAGAQGAGAPSSAGAAPCAACDRKVVAGYAAPCSHVCCYGCWLRALDGPGVCPRCGAAVQKRQLRQLTF